MAGINLSLHQEIVKKTGPVNFPNSAHEEKKPLAWPFLQKHDSGRPSFFPSPG